MATGGSSAILRPPNASPTGQTRGPNPLRCRARPPRRGHLPPEVLAVSTLMAEVAGFGSPRLPGSGLIEAEQSTLKIHVQERQPQRK